MSVICFPIDCNVIQDLIPIYLLHIPSDNNDNKIVHEYFKNHPLQFIYGSLNTLNTPEV